MLTVDPLDDVVVCRSDNPQVTVEPEPEAPHAQIEEDTYGHDDKRGYVHPAMLERTRVRLDGKNRILVQIGQHDIVPRITQIGYNLLQVFVDAFYLVIGCISEENLYDIRCPIEFVRT